MSEEALRLSCDYARGFYRQMWQLFFDEGHLQHIIYIMRFVLVNLLPVK